MLAASVASGCGDGKTSDNGTDGAVNHDAGPVCGNGVTEGLEECDDGVANSDTEPDACRTDCQTSWCGDTVKDSAEECDDGLANSDSEPNACRTDCRTPVCGDAILDDALGEECDDGAGNSDAPNLPSCRTSCRLRGCGDGILDDADLEICDDGGVSDGDGCAADCGSVELFWECAGTAPSVCECIDLRQGANCLDCVVYVDPDPGIVVRDGASWATAVDTIQAGIDLAAATATYCQVWVIEGDYNVFGAHLQLAPTLSLFGGFAGTEARLSDRSSWQAHPTVLDGADPTDPSNRGVVMSTGNGVDIRVGGFTIVGATSAVSVGNTTFFLEDTLSVGNDVGVTMSSGSEVDIRRTTFEAHTSRAIGAWGGVLAVSDATFLNNQSTVSGPAIAMLNEGAIILDRCTFIGNATTEYGGAVSYQGTMTVQDSDFLGNSSGNSGSAISQVGTGATLVQGCTFDANTGSAAIYGSGGGVFTIISSAFTNNGSLFGGTSGALYLSTATIEDSSFVGNSSFADGGAIVVTSDATIIGSLFENNTSGNDGGAAYLQGDTIIVGSTFINNTAVASMGGGAIYQEFGTLVIEASRFLGNTGSQAGGAVYLHATDAVISSSLFVANSAGGGRRNLRQDLERSQPGQLHPGQ